MGIGILAAALAMPVTRIGTIAWLALVVDLVLAISFVATAVLLRPPAEFELNARTSARPT